MFPDLHRYAFTILNDTDRATDVVQEVFIKYHQQLSNGSVISFDKAYLYRSVYNMAVSALRKQAVMQKHESMSAASGSDSNVQDMRIAEEQNVAMQALAAKILAVLPEQCKAVFLKSRSEGKKYREIAIEMGISIKTVEAHISKALKIIQELVRVNRDKISLIQIVLLYELFC